MRRRHPFERRVAGGSSTEALVRTLPSASPWSSLRSENECTRDLSGILAWQAGNEIREHQRTEADENDLHDGNRGLRYGRDLPSELHPEPTTERYAKRNTTMTPVATAIVDCQVTQLAN
jgi:hypothetical protein